jgi:hypothetical protein
MNGGDIRGPLPPHHIWKVSIWHPLTLYWAFKKKQRCCWQPCLFLSIIHMLLFLKIILFKQQKTPIDANRRHADWSVRWFVRCECVLQMATPYTAKHNVCLCILQYTAPCTVYNFINAEGWFIKPFYQNFNIYMNIEPIKDWHSLLTRCSVRTSLDIPRL